MFKMLNGIEQAPEDDPLETVTEEEVILLWRAIRTNYMLSEKEAWNVIATGIALDMAFEKSKSIRDVEH